MNKTSAKNFNTDMKSNTSSSCSLKIGELLVYEGFATKGEIENALNIQAEEKQYLNLRIGEILVKMGELSDDDLQHAVNHPDLKKKLGSLAVEKGLVKKKDLETVLNKKKPGQTIGDLLVNYGLLTHNDIGNLLKTQLNSPKLGQILVDLKLISESTLQEALKRQNSTRALGEILCDLKIITNQDLHYILKKYNKQIALEEILVRSRIIDKEKLNKAKQEAEHTSKPLEDILIKKKFISSEQLQSALAKQYNIAFEHLNNFTYSASDKKNLTNLIQQKYAEKNLLLPLSLTEKNLKIAISNPGILSLTSELKSLYPTLEISFVLTTHEKLEELFEVLFSRRLSAESSQNQDLHESDEMDFMEIDLDENLDANNEQAPDYGSQDIEAEEIVNFIIKYGILNNASDIHIEQDRHSPKLRYRIDGVLQDNNVGWLKKKFQEKINAIISRIKVMSNLDIAERRLPQDGVFRTNYYDKAKNQKFDLDFRVATCRAIVGENVTIRILDSRKASVGLENLNHSAHVVTPFKRLLKSSAGIILVSGPTGSGKSSSLYGALRFVYNPGVKIITAEDPIEYSFPGIMQTQINPKIDLTFSRLLRSFLRLDPDVILVGEIRDRETAAISFDAAQTGHLLLSTIHTNDSISAVSRLVDLNIEYKQIASCLLAVLAQRLIRKICTSCKEEYVPGEDELELLFTSYPSHLKFYRGRGCESCNYSGYSGRILISEIFVIDKEIGMALSEGVNDAKIKTLAVESGMNTMLDDGLLKLNDTTLSELIRVVPQDMIQAFKMRNNAQIQANDISEIVSRNSTGQSGSSISSQNFIISNPDRQSEIIETMFQDYNNINTTNNNVIKGAIPLFKQFITENFYKICRENHCAKVVFTIKPNNGLPEISALPDRK